MFKKQELKQVSAYEKKVTHDIFEMTMEWLEKYIEIAHKREFPDWENRKQIRNNLTIKRTDIYGNPKEAGDAFSTQLLLFESNLRRRPSFIREEIQKEYYQWMSAVGINSNNCPERLKHYLFGINEILEGRGEKIRKDVENEKPAVDSNSPEYMQQMSNLFSNTYNSAKDEIETEKSLKGKTHRDWKTGSKFGSGNVEQGEQVFGQINQEVANRHNDFHFFPQKDQQRTASSSVTQPNNLQQSRGTEIASQYDNETLEHEYRRVQAKLKREINWEVIDSEQGLKQWLVELETERIKRSASEWKVERVKIFQGNRSQPEKWEFSLINQWANLNAYNQWGYLEDPGKIYFAGSYHFEQLARPQLEKDNINSSSQQYYSQALEIKETIQVQPTANDKPSISTGTVAIIGVSIATVVTGIFFIFITKPKKKLRK